MGIRTTTTTTTTAIDLCNRMLQTLLSLQLHKLHIKQVCSFFSLFPFKHHFFTTSLEEPHSPSSSSSHKTNITHIDISSINISGIAKSVIHGCSYLYNKKGDAFCRPSLKENLLKLSNLSPETTRRLWKVSDLKPHDVLEILRSFECGSEKFEIESKKIESLWGIFKWASEQSRDFKHLPLSCKLMASMLVRVGLFRDAELLLSTVENQGVLLDCREIFSNLIERYVGSGELGSAISVYDQMRGLGLVPLLSSYRVLLNLLVQLNETQLAFRVYVDMVDMGLGVSNTEKGIYENVIQLLCNDGRVQEARNLVKKVYAFGMKPSNPVINVIACGYCEKKDYDDLLSLFFEMKCVPDIVVGNKIVFSLCRSYGVERAKLFMRELEHLGFCPDEATFGILICWSCCEGKLKDAFISLSEVWSRGLKPHIYSYTALICGVFKEGLWKHAQDIVHEMDDKGIKANMSTFRVLLAGYCKARQFDEVKMTVGKMVDSGLIQLSPQEDPVSKSFMLLGLDPMTVKVRRDNGMGFPKTEFFDNIGNGLYLETDLEEYEETVTAVLDNSMIPDFNSFLLNYCADGNFRIAVVMVDEMALWGQEPSLSAFSTLVEGICASGFCVKAITSLLDRVPKLTNQLNQETLNLLVQALSRKGFTYKAKGIFDMMLQRHLEIMSKTYTALLMGLCKKRNLSGFHDCWKLAREVKWLPELKDFKTLLVCLCQQKMLKEALELLEGMLAAYPHDMLDICHAFLEKLCDTGFTATAHVLVEKLLNRGYALDHITCNHLIRGFCKEKKFLEAFTILDTMSARDLALQYDVSVLLIPELCRSGNVEKAVALKEIVLREQPSNSISVYHALMSGFCRIGMVEEVADLFQDILSKGLFPDTELYNILVQGYCRANNLGKVRDLLGVMIRKNLSVSISSFRNLVRLNCMEGGSPFALSVKDLMLKESNSSYLVVYNILIFYLFSMGNSLLVDSVLDELKEKGLQPDGVTYNFVVYGFSRCKAVSHALQYLYAMMSKELRPSNRSLRAVIKGLCYDGELGKALKLSREMESRGWPHCSSIQNNIVDGLLARGKIQEAVDFLDRMVTKDLVPDNINYDNLIKQLCCYGSQDKAVHLLDVMLKKGSLPSSTSYDHIIQGFCRCHKLDWAQDFLTEMLEINLKASVKTWNILIHHLCTDGKIAEAERLLNSMVHMGETPSREMYCSVINRYRFENNFMKASELLQAMQKNGYEPDFGTHWSLISNLSTSAKKDNSNNSHNFLSSLLSESGFTRKDPKAKLG